MYHFVEGYAPQAVGGVDAPVGCYWEVEQQTGVAAHRFIICIHEL